MLLIYFLLYSHYHGKEAFVSGDDDDGQIDVG